ncbi:uncharacterized protein LOC108041431 [Drosophila rhopaloa]|uniref:Uncharacterized protein LOC108041431 n=1 Tax=Drosophila rhopaloa TaxID=1041015 RepID=A0A6P4EIN7_DRORH|nr:uncharacterized protein LOC108041431 [Drosophila rhopaloa]
MSVVFKFGTHIYFIKNGIARMLSLRNGIFAGSLLGSGSCFQRLAPCSCRSSRRPLPRNSAKKPFKPQLDNSSDSVEKQRLLALMETGCRCPCRSAKERWFFTNRRIILSLATALNRPPDLVCDFLHSLTLQNFSRILKPAASSTISCKVPYVNCNVCENYMSIFDTRGNVRSRFSQDSLELLMRVVQTVLKHDSLGEAEQFDTSFGAQRGAEHRDSMAKRAGIDRDSTARQNGKRRLRNSEARAQLTKSRFHSGLEKPTIGDPGYIFGNNFQPTDLDAPVQKPENWAPTDSRTPRLSQQLANLLMQVNDKTYLTRDPDQLIAAIRNLELDRIVNRPRPPSTDDKIVKRISDSYYERVNGFGLKSQLKKRRKTLKGNTKEDDPKLWEPRELREQTEPREPRNRVYYGEPPPVLLHAPFNPEKLWTWLRWHPHRMDEGQESEGINRRYSPNAMEQLMQRSKQRSSVHTAISPDKGSKFAKIKQIFRRMQHNL